MKHLTARFTGPDLVIWTLVFHPIKTLAGKVLDPSTRCLSIFRMLIYLIKFEWGETFFSCRKDSAP